MKLEINEEKTFLAIARNNPDEIIPNPVEYTQIEVTAGQRYDFVVPDGERWTDFYFIRCGADGFFYPFSRKNLWEPRARYFVLCGIILPDPKQTFPIGKCLKNFEIPVNGQLRFFANDVRSFYHNNRGTIRINVKRLT